MIGSRPPLPRFTRETAIQKVRAAEDGGNNREIKKPQSMRHFRDHITVITLPIPRQQIIAR